MGAMAVGAVLVGCGSGETPSPSSPSVETSSGSETDQSSASPTTRSESLVTTTETVTASPVPLDTPTKSAPVIVGCQQGLGPVQTYWSDGRVTGYSDYCQAVHDETLEGEVAANTPSCDGTVCRYPSGATMPDPNATPDDRCTNLINYANDPRSNAEINSIGAETGQCPEPIG